MASTGQNSRATASPLVEDNAAWRAQDDADDSAIRDLLNQTQTPGGLDLNIFHDQPFDQTNKADDAQDFEDISDGDLPDEEDEDLAVHTSLEVPGLTDDADSPHDTDDLFGEGRESSPFDALFAPTSPAQSKPDGAVDDTVDDGASIASPNFRDLNFDLHDSLLGNQDPDIPAAAETREDLLRAAWPTFRAGTILSWCQLLPTKKLLGLRRSR